jgi:hypothetical protein
MPMGFGDIVPFLYQPPALGTGAAAQLRAGENTQQLLMNLAQQFEMQRAQRVEEEQRAQGMAEADARGKRSLELQEQGIQGAETRFNRELSDRQSGRSEDRDFEREKLRKAFSTELSKAMYAGDLAQVRALAPTAAQHGLKVELDNTPQTEGVYGLDSVYGGEPGAPPGLSSIPVSTPRKRVLIRDDAGNQLGEVDLNAVQGEKSEAMRQYLDSMLASSRPQDRAAREMGFGSATNLPGLTLDQMREVGSHEANAQLNRESSELRTALGTEASLEGKRISAGSGDDATDQRLEVAWEGKVMKELNDSAQYNMVAGTDSNIKAAIAHMMDALEKGDVEAFKTGVKTIATVREFGQRQSDADFRYSAEDIGWLNRMRNEIDKASGEVDEGRARRLLNGLLNHDAINESRKLKSYELLKRRYEATRWEPEKRSIQKKMDALFGGEDWYQGAPTPAPSAPRSGGQAQVPEAMPDGSEIPSLGSSAAPKFDILDEMEKKAGINAGS